MPPLLALLLATQTYTHEADWPRRPETAAWAAMAGMAVDAKDNVWIFTRANPTVQVYTAAGAYVRGWGDTDLHRRAHHLKIDAKGNVWLADVGSHVIRKCTPDGHVLMTLGTPDTPGEDGHHFNKPTDMAVAADGSVFVSDGYGNNRVVHFDDEGRFVKAWGTKGTKPGEFDLPHAIGIDSKQRLYVADRGNGRVQVFDTAGTPLARWKGDVVPWGIWVTPKDEIWICGSATLPVSPPPDQVLVKFDVEGNVRARVPIPKGDGKATKPGACDWVHAIAADSAGNLYVGDIKGERAQKFAPDR